ncbi:MAG TPA: hypothetical protein PKE39_05470 [Ignavibacteria bacterium]|nr:hypothetical protein [Ignavibacteria bacterium]HMQ98452.1 hypothetical protein [Ignavibacteria bacterium]
MAGGPSKQELEMYWQNSRQYFDELARHYQTADPEYYREFIKPFYNNPFRSAGSGNTGRTGGGGGKVMVIAVFLLVLIGALSAGLFFILGSSETVIEKVEEITSDKNVSEQKTTKEKKITREESGVTEESPVTEENPEVLSAEDNYIIGAKYIAEKKYDKAAWHLKQIKKEDKRYKEAQQLLESIKYLKKYNK